MTQTLIGLDYEGVPCIKMTKDAYDPATTPDSQVGAFLYNSKWAADVKYSISEIVPRPTSGYYLPSGTNANSYEWFCSTGPANGTQLHVYRHRVTAEMPYSMPLMEMKAINNSNNRYVGERFLYLKVRGFEERGVKLGTAGGLEYGWMEGTTTNNSSLLGSLNHSTMTYTFGNTSILAPYKKLLSVWRLPGDETAILHGQQRPPVAGMDSIVIDSTALKVAKTGYNVHTATPTQLAINTANNPAKIVAADDISLPSNATTSYNTGFTLPAGTVVEVHYYEGGTVYYPASPAGSTFGADYYISGSNIVFVNAGRACRARFMVVAHDGSPPTVGNNDVLRQFNDGKQDVVQFLKPNAAANPSFADIALDSRWPCIQILAEGTINLTSGAKTYEVPFNGSGVFPMVKYMTIHGAGRVVDTYGGITFNYSKRIRQPFTAVTYIDRPSTPYGWTETGDCTYCKLTTNKATFHSFLGRPTEVYYNDMEDFDRNRVSYEYDPNPPTSIRYYIFGIAK